MSRKAIFFDIDGTLCDEQNRIPESVYGAVAEMKAAGHAVLICSGRSRAYIFDEKLLQMGFDGIVSGAGSRVELHGRVLLDTLAPPAALTRAVETARACGYGPLLEGNRYLYMDRADFEPSPYIDKLYRELGGRIRPLGEQYGAWPDVPKLSVIARGTPCPDRLLDAYKSDWDVIVHMPEVLEMTMPGVSKGTGLRLALGALGIDKEDSVAFGDSPNDLAMFEAAGLGIAMGNADTRLRARADYVTTGLWEDGILHAWEWLKERQ